MTIDGLAGVTAIDCSAGGVGGVTVNTVVPTTEFNVALIVLVPTPAPVAKPPAVIVATPGVAEAHVTVLVRFCSLLSL